MSFFRAIFLAASVWPLVSSSASLLAAPSAQVNSARLPLVFEKFGEKYVSRSGRITLSLAAQSITFHEPGRRAVQMRLEGSSVLAVPDGEKRQSSYSNYYAGSDPRQWRINVPHYGQVRYRSVYPGIDLVFHGNQRQLEYDFVLAPGADPRQISLSFDGVQGWKIDANGDLTLDTGHGTLRQHSPAIYQEIDGERRPVSGRYVRQSRQRVGFQVANYDVRKPLVIDPILTYATYLGGTGADTGKALAVDSNGNIYLGGLTSSPDFPATAQYSVSTVPNQTVYVSKLNPAGTGLLYTTAFKAGNLQAIAVDNNGNVYATGRTTFDTPVTAGAYKTTRNTNFNDSYVVKLNSTGQISYSTFLTGSTGSALSNGIAVDTAGRAFVCGTASQGYPVSPGAYQTLPKGQYDAFVTVLNSTGTGIAYSTLLGGNGVDFATGIALTPSGNAVITGTTDPAPNNITTDFPVTAGAAQTTAGGGTDVFVAQFNATGTALVYSTLLGGSWVEFANAIAVDSMGSAYVTGTVRSTDFPVTSGAYQTTPGTGFLSKISPSGGTLMYSTYFASTKISCGSGAFVITACDGGAGIAVDASGNAYVVGTTASPDFPITAGALQTNATNQWYYSPDAFLFKMNPSGSLLLYSTVLGGSDGDSGEAVALDSAGNVYLTGSTTSSNYPVTSDGFQKISGRTIYSAPGDTDSYLARIAFTPAACSVSVSTMPLALPASASTGTIAVTAPAGCPWSAFAATNFVSGDWLSLTGAASGVGSGTVTYSAALNYANTGRSGQIVVAGQVIPVTQAALPCTITLVPSAVTTLAGGGGSVLHVATPGGCFWQVSSNIPWITVGTLFSYPGGGDGDVVYTLAPNSGPSRIGTILVGDQTFTVVQGAPGCTYTLDRPGSSYPPNSLTGSVNLTAGAGCLWNITTTASWIHPGVTTGSGSASIAYLLDANTGDSYRFGTLTIAGQTFNIDQAPPCDYTVTPTSLTAPAGGGTGAISVTTLSRCSWSYNSNSGWIGIVPVPSRTGSGTITYSVSPNSGPAHIGTLTVAGQTVTISQAGNPNALTTTADVSLYDTYSAFTAPVGSLISRHRTITLSSASNAVPFTATVSGSPVFVAVSQDSGTTPAVLTLTVSPTLLGPGTYTNLVAFQSGNAVSLYTVSLTVSNTAAKAGIYRSSSGLVLLDRNGDGGCCTDDLVGTIGQSGDIPLAGDWTGDGIKKLGLYRPSTGLFLLDVNNSGAFDAGDKALFLAGQPGDVPVVGDWTGTGRDRVGVFRGSNGTWYLDNNGDGSFVGRAFLGQAGDIPLVGNWNGTGKQSKAGIYRPNALGNQPGNFFLVDLNGDGVYTSADGPPFFMGQSGDVPLVGDWNGDGRTKVGIFRPTAANNSSAGLFVLDANGNYAWDGAGTDKVLFFAPYLVGFNSTTFQPGDLVITGDWTPSYGGPNTLRAGGTTRTGIYRPSTGTFFVDISADGTFQGRAYLGQPGDIPVGVPVIQGGAVTGVNALGSF